MSQQTNFKMVISAKYLIKHRLWDRVCDALGWDVYAISDGRMDIDDLVTIDVPSNRELCRAISEAGTEVENVTEAN